MPLEYQMKHGQLYFENGHSDPEDKTYEKLIAEQRLHAKDVVFDYNNTRPSDLEKKKEMLISLFAEGGDSAWIEAPMFVAYGCNTHLGKNFYANFNMVLVDDCEIFIGDNVMFGPNVTISVTGHPIDGEMRRKGTQFSLPVKIGNDVWVGSNVVILPGVSIGNNVVIGAGSVVTHDIPDNSVAMGVPCKVARAITEDDKLYFRKGIKVNEDWCI